LECRLFTDRAKAEKSGIVFVGQVERRGFLQCLRRHQEDKKSWLLLLRKVTSIVCVKVDVNWEEIEVALICSLA
jgi:hypothetical protein